MKPLFVKKARVSLKLGRMSVLRMIDYSNSVVQAMTGNPSFPKPTPNLSSVTKAIKQLQNAHKKMRSRAPGTKARVDSKRYTLHTLMTGLGGYIELTANKDRKNAETIAKSAGVNLYADPGPKPQGFRLKRTRIPGEAKLFTTWIRSASYQWQYTTTPDDPKSWISLETNVSKITIPNLPRGRYSFRVAVIQATKGPWSQILSGVIG